MKKIIITTLTVIMIGTGNLFSQNPMFPVPEFLKEIDGVKYYYVDIGPIRTIFSETNRFTNVFRTMKDGSKLTEEYDMGGVRTSGIAPDKREMTTEIVNSNLYRYSKDIKGETLYVSLKINPETGKIWDVEFEFNKTGKITTAVPVEAFRQIEVDLRQFIDFTITEAGKRLNYCFFWWKHKF